MYNEEIIKNRAQQLFLQAIEECENAGVPIGYFETEVFINSRARKRWGACKKVGTKGLFNRRQAVFRIEISKQLVENGSDFDIKNTLVHELIHTCKGCMNHGKLWAYHAARMNSIYGYHVKTTSSGDDMEAEELHQENRQIDYKYLARCKGCGAEIYRMKRSKFIECPDNYKCRKCGAKFEIFELNLNADKQSPIPYL